MTSCPGMQLTKLVCWFAGLSGDYPSRAVPAPRCSVADRRRSGATKDSECSTAQRLNAGDDHGTADHVETVNEFRTASGS